LREVIYSQYSISLYAIQTFIAETPMDIRNAQLFLHLASSLNFARQPLYVKPGDPTNGRRAER
jgi:hypothetical protein